MVFVVRGHAQAHAEARRRVCGVCVALRKEVLRCAK